MTRRHSPGPDPADHPADTTGNGKRAVGYFESDLDDEVSTEESLVTGPAHGGVAVFQAPQPARGRPATPVGRTPRPAPRPVELPDIDSPFLDLFGSAPLPPATPTGRRGASTDAAAPAPAQRDERGSVHRIPGPVAAGPHPGPGTPAPVNPTAARKSPPGLDDPTTSTPTWPTDDLLAEAVPVTDVPRPGTDRPAAGTPGRSGGPDQSTRPDRDVIDRGRTPGRPTRLPAPREPEPFGPPPHPDQTQTAGPAGARPDAYPGEPHGSPARATRSATPSDPTVAAPPTRPDTSGQPIPTPPTERPDQYGDPADGDPAGRHTSPRWEGRTSSDGRLGAAAPEPDHHDQAEHRALQRTPRPPERRDRKGAARATPAKPIRVRPPKVRFGDRDPAVELAITEIAGHLTFTPNTVTAWYWLPEVRWAFRPDAEREALLAAISEQYAGLAGFRLHLRRTTRPFPADEWARTVDAHTPHPLATVPGSVSWSDHLVAAQRHLLSVNHAEGQTYLGVTFARRSLGDSLTERLLRTFGRGTAEGERRKLGRTVEQFDEVLGAFGMRGRRVTAQELEWLLYRSVALCMAPPGTLSPVTNGRWERGDLLALTEQVERYRTPYGSTVKLVNRMTGEERHVAVLAVGRMEPLEIPERHEPWLHFHERLPWPMELSTRVDVLGSSDSFRNLEHRLRMIRSQQLDYHEHGIDAPPELERLAKRALVIGDEMTTGLPVDSARAHGWHRIAVGGRSREECLERARRLIQLYSRELRISLQHPKNQDWLAREFIPGEPIANTGYLRRMPVPLLAAALPQAASTVGDRRGDLIGRTAGTCRRPVFLDLHFPMEVRERSGLAVFVAEPGGGKSTLLGALGYLAARRGVQVTLLDPSGPLARLCAMPELRPYSRVLNLTGSEQGTLAPYSLIPTPLRSEFPVGASGDREFEIAVSNARAERRMLVQDICMMLVPPQVAREASTATLLRHAVRQVPAEETSTLDDVVVCLSGLDDDDGKELANLLLDTAEMPLALLFFGRPPPGLLGADAALTVITMAGLRLPDLKIEREYWSAEEALALPMLHTAHRLAVRRCYGGLMSSRKMVGLDEAHFMEGWRSGRSFLVRLARDSRKWNLAALVASQNPRDILGLDVQNLVSTVFVGRIAEDTEIASEALRLLRVPVDDGYEATLASLSAVDASSAARLGFREFVMRDVDGRVQKVRVDVSYVQGLLEHLDTTPTTAAALQSNLATDVPELEE
nr:ATP-binding protein [Micromonospora sp. DSM 115978]